jgi:chromatin remodeling complex protein RSC6
MAKAKAKAKPRKKTVAKKKKPAAARKKSGLAQTSYELSEQLAEIVGGKKMTRPQVVKKMWVYIKAKKLQDAKNRRMINPDAKLAEVIGKKPVDMLKLAGHINKHIKK